MKNMIKLTIGLALLDAQLANASTTLFNNLLQTSSGSSFVGWMDTNPHNYNFYSDSAQGFQTPAGPAYTLDTVTLRVNRYDLMGDAPLTVSIYSGAPGPTGSALETLTLVAGTIPVESYGSTNFGLVTYSSAGLSLAGGSTYWVVLSATDGTDINTNLTDYAWSTENSSTAIASQSNIYCPGEPSWDEPWYTNGSTKYQMSVLASGGVPEPSTLAIVALGGLGMLYQRRRR